MNAFKKECIALREQGYSITEIVKATGRAKSSIYPYIKDIPLSEERIRQSRTVSGKRIREFALARKGKSARSFRALDTWSTNSVLLIAHLLFDGEIARTRCSYNNRSKTLIERVEHLMREWYDIEPKRYKNPTTGVLRISYNNVALAAHIDRKSKELLYDIKKIPVSLKRFFLKAFFDDEGCMDYRPEKNRRSIRGYQKDVQVLKTIKALLVDFGITAKIVLPNEVVIVGKENLIRFEREINFSPGVYMNGSRSNSRWKKHVEKRELLRQAIASFKS